MPRSLSICKNVKISLPDTRFSSTEAGVFFEYYEIKSLKIKKTSGVSWLFYFWIQ